MNKITIISQRPQLDIKTTPAKLDIQRPKPKMRISHKRASFSAQRKLPRFKLNWDKAREAGGLPYGMLRALQNHAAQSNSKTLEAIAKIAQRGDMAANFHTGQSSAMQMARQAADEKLAEVNVRREQPGMPEVEWENGELVVQWQNYELHIEWDIEKPIVQVEPYSVEIRLTNKPKVTISVDGDRLPKLPNGRKVDKRL